MDVVGNCLRKEEKPKDTPPNGGKDSLGFSHDQAVLFLADSARWISLKE